MKTKKPTAPYASNWKRNMERTIENVLNVYYKRTPRWKLRKFFRMIQSARQSLINSMGFSPNKVTLHVAEVPQQIFYVMVKLFGPEWRNDRKISAAFFKKVAKFRINETTTPMTDESQIGRETYGEPVPPEESP